MSQAIKELPFPWPCSKCHQQMVERDTQPYCTDVQYDGRTYTIEVPEFHVPRCKNCGTMVLDDRANDQITDALHRQVGLLTPAQIRKNREALGLKQRDFASLLGVGESTVSRWETGAQIQQRSLDKLMRLCFAIPEARDALADKDQLATLGSDLVLERPVVRPEKAPTTGAGTCRLGAISTLFNEPSPSDEMRRFKSWREYRDHLTHEPSRYKLTHTAKFYSCVLKSFREERKQNDPASLFLESLFSSRHDLFAALEVVSPDVARLVPLVSCWAVLTDSTTRTQWRSLFEVRWKHLATSLRAESEDAGIRVGGLLLLSEVFKWATSSNQRDSRVSRRI